jgi:uncharacterized membrane protein YccF (DUF307 family)
MRAIGNFLWFMLGGAVMGLAWWLFGLLAMLTIVGIPWARACFVIGKLSFLPFGREVIGRAELRGVGDIGTGPFGIVGNVMWCLFAGLWLALGHLALAIFDFLIVIGIPFGIQHLKLAGIALAPIGKAVVLKETAAAARRTNAEAYVAALRNRAA